MDICTKFHQTPQKYGFEKFRVCTSFKSLGLCSPNKYEVDLSNEVLNIDFGQGAAKISEVKVGG